jgi:Ricin-type beta-trefoil lectin domain.
MALIIMSFTSIQANAAIWPTDASSLNVIAYPLDAESRSIPAYSDVEMTRKIGTVYGSDKCTILSGNGNAILIQYPIKGGRTKTGYVAVSAFSNADLNGGSHQEARAQSDFTAYAYKTGNLKLGTVYRDDSISIVYSDHTSGRTQVIYPTDSGYKMGWIDWMPEDSNNTSDAGAATVQQGVYTIRSAMDNNMVMDLFLESTDYGTNIQLFRDNNGRNQQFHIIPAGDNWYKICSVLDERMCVDVYGGLSEPGSNVCLWEYHNQLWRFIPCGDGTYLIESHLGLYLDVENAENRNEANIIAFSKNGNANQRWRLEAVSSDSGSTASEEAKIAKKLDDLGNGVYDDNTNTFSVNKVYRGTYSSEQCKGYAKRLFQICFGYTIGSTGNKSSGNNYKININSSKTDVVGSLAGSNMSEQALQTLFSNAKPGDFVQLRRRHTGSHSMIFYSYDNEGATFYESNLDNKNTIKKNRYTWSQLYSNNAGISVYRAKDYWLH